MTAVSPLIHPGQPPGVPVDFPSRLAAQMKDTAAKLVLDEGDGRSGGFW